MIATKHVIDSLPLIADILGRKYGVRVRINGDTARTDGKTIHIPSLPLNGGETLIGMVRGFIDHESAHLRETDFTVLTMEKPSPVEKHIWNILEDWRVENKLSAVFPGCRHNLLWLVRHIFRNTPGDQPVAPGMEILNWLLCSVRAWDVPEVGQERDKSAALVDKAFPGLLPQLDAILQTVPSRCNSTRDALDLAREIAAILEQHAQRAESLAQSGSGTEQGNEAGESQVAPAASATPEGMQGLRDVLHAGESMLPKDWGEVLAESLQGQCAVPEARLQVAVATCKPTALLSPEARLAARTATTALRTRIQALLQSERLVRNRRGLRGRVDTGALHRLAINNPRVFVRQGCRQGLHTAVHILLDCSGSMAGAAVELAGQACFAVASALVGIPGINAAVTAFPGESTEPDSQGNRCHQTVAPILRHRENMHGRFCLSAMGGTPMAEALWWVLQQMQVLHEQRKIILLVTDGEPHSRESVQTAIRTAERMGCEVCGIGLGTPSILTLLPQRSRHIQTITELAPAMFAVLQQRLLRRNAG